ncbi:MAG: peptidyl-prolyl cis-trans isomerase [Candidatus Omnitrophica bacterium]|nr:peptidyl-prolyl cis-trans isomerase [Candidatus Omnitrophota bacterium]
MRSILTCVLVAGLVSFLGAGCDKLPDFGMQKDAPSPEAGAPSDMPVVKGTPIAKVNNFTITLEQMSQEIEAYNAMVPEDKPEAKITTLEQKISYVKEQMVRAMLLYQEALDRRLDANEEVSRILERTKRELLVMELLRQEADNLEVTSAEIEDYYNLYKDQIKEPEERQIREIVLATEAEAKDVLIQLLQGADFSTLARERSRAQSAREGGSLGFVKPQDKFKEFDQVAFSDTLEEGQVSNLFRGPDGFYILKIEKIRGGKAKSLTEVWDDIKRTLTFLKQQQQIEELVSQLSTKARIEVYEGEIR